METKQNRMFSISRRKAIAGLLVTGVSLTTGIMTTGSAFAATASSLVQAPIVKKLKAGIKKKQLSLKHQTLRGKGAKATLKTFKLKTTTQARPLAAADAQASFTAYPVNSTSNPENKVITTGDDGSSFWFTEYGANRIGKITTQGAITEYLLPLSNYRPFGIANGPDDTFWFTYKSNASDPSVTAFVGRLIGASGQVTLYALPQEFWVVSNITRGPNDTLWFTSYDGAIGSMTADGTITSYSISNISELWSITSGPDGALWFGLYDKLSKSYGIGRITTGGAYTFYPVSDSVGEVTMGRNNDIWFVEPNSNLISNITTNGQLTEYSLPNIGAIPIAIAHLGNGTFAFGTGPASGAVSPTEYIGTITPAGDVQMFSTPNNDTPSHLVYAGWANEVWFTTKTKIYKFRLTN
jgi:virginiamycin B lyase